MTATRLASKALVVHEFRVNVTTAGTVVARCKCTRWSGNVAPREVGLSQEVTRERLEGLWLVHAAG